MTKMEKLEELLGHHAAVKARDMQNILEQERLTLLIDLRTMADEFLTEHSLDEDPEDLIADLMWQEWDNELG